MAETRVTVYCDDNYPPYSYLENGEVKGIYTEILKPAFSRMKAYDVQVEAVPYKRGLYLLRTGKGFALYPPYFRPATRPYIDYSVKILGEILVVFLRRSIADKHRPTVWPGDFYGLTVGKNHGFEISRNQAYMDAVKAGKLRIEEAAGNRANILKLGMARIDAYVNDRISVLWELNRLKKTGRYDEGGDHEMIVEGISLSVRVRSSRLYEPGWGTVYLQGGFHKRVQCNHQRNEKNGEDREDRRRLPEIEHDNPRTEVVPILNLILQHTGNMHLHLGVRGWATSKQNQAMVVLWERSGLRGRMNGPMDEVVIIPVSYFFRDGS